MVTPSLQPARLLREGAFAEDQHGPHRWALIHWPMLCLCFPEFCEASASVEMAGGREGRAGPPKAVGGEPLSPLTGED